MFELMSTCLDIWTIIQNDCNKDFEKRSIENFKTLFKRAQYKEIAITQILEEYNSFKSLVQTLSTSSKEENDFIRLFEFVLFKHHECKA